MNNIVAALFITLFIVIVISLFNSQTGNIIIQENHPECNSTCPECEYPEPEHTECPEDVTPYSSCDSCCEEIECEQVPCNSCCPSCPQEANEDNCQQFCAECMGTGESNETHEETTEYLYVGSVNSNKYHYPDCQYAKNIKEENQIWFIDEQDAQNQGYIPCGSCKPPS